MSQNKERLDEAAAPQLERRAPIVRETEPHDFELAAPLDLDAFQRPQDWSSGAKGP